MQVEKVENFTRNSKEGLKSAISLERTNAKNARFVSLIHELDRNLQATYNNNTYKYDANIQIGDLSTVVLASIAGITIGSGCFKELDSHTVELKRMFVNPYFRGVGVASRILTELCDWAKELNYSRAVLETGIRQLDSILLFEKKGFTRIENFGIYNGIEGSICMMKTL